MMETLREYFADCVEFYQIHPFLVGVFVSLFTVLFLSLLVEAILLYRRSRKVKFLSFETDNGSVNVSAEAVRGLIRVISRDFNELNLGNIHMIRRKKQIILCMSVEYICGSRTLPEVIDLFEKRTFDDLVKILGVSIDKIKTTVRHVRTPDDEGRNDMEIADIPMVTE